MAHPLLQLPRDVLGKILLHKFGTPLPGEVVEPSYTSPQDAAGFRSRFATCKAFRNAMLVAAHRVTFKISVRPAPGLAVVSAAEVNRLTLVAANPGSHTASGWINELQQHGVVFMHVRDLQFKVRLLHMTICAVTITSLLELGEFLASSQRLPQQQTDWARMPEKHKVPNKKHRMPKITTCKCVARLHMFFPCKKPAAQAECQSPTGLSDSVSQRLTYELVCEAHGH